MAVRVADKIKQFNDADFFLMDAKDVEMSEGKSVEEKMDEKCEATNIQNGSSDGSLKSLIAIDAISEGAIALGKNSIAGSKCFNITAFDDANKAYTLDSVEGLEVGDVYSLKLDYIYDNKGTITAINGNVVTVDNYQPDENADKYFRVVSKPTCGTTDFGINAFAEGEECMAVGDNSHASGLKTRAEGRYSHTEGRETVAHSVAHAEGVKCEARGYASHAEGEETLASKPQAHAEGVKTQANGQASHAEGMYGKANGKAARVSGYGCKANGDYSEASGVNTEANGEHSRASGYGCKANGKGSCAVGRYTTANGEYSNVRGKLNEVDNDNKYAEIVGNGDASKRSNAYTLDWNGNARYSGEVEDGKGNKLSEKAQKNETSNVVKGVKGGTSVLVDDVSPITHDVGVVVNMPNTLEYPYKETTHAWGGITFTDNGDGSITANGTATTWVNFTLVKSKVFPNGTYILTGCPKGVSRCNVNVSLYRDSSTTAIKQVIDSGNGSPEFNFDGVDYDSYNIKITITTGAVCDNLVFRPKLCVSPTTTTLTVKDENYEVQATYTPNADGSVSGVKSVYPAMKLELSDTTSDMTVEYNKDINAAMNEKADKATPLNNITSITTETLSDSTGAINVLPNKTTFLDGGSAYVQNWYSDNIGSGNKITLYLTMPGVTLNTFADSDGLEHDYTLIIKTIADQTFSIDCWTGPTNFDGMNSNLAYMRKANSTLADWSTAKTIGPNKTVMFKFKKLAVSTTTVEDDISYIHDYVVYDVITLEGNSTTGEVGKVPDEDL